MWTRCVRVLCVVACLLPARALGHTYSNEVPNPVPALGPAQVYPSVITIPDTGFALVSHVTVRLTISHTAPSELRLLLVSPSGLGVVLMADAGGFETWDRLTIGFSDCAPRYLHFTSEGSGGQFRPTSRRLTAAWPAPAPQDDFYTSLAALNGKLTAGDWKLFVVNLDGWGGTIHSWSLAVHQVNDYLSTPPPTSPWITIGNPVPCSTPDYDGDGRADIAVYSAASGEWIVAESSHAGFVQRYPWGATSNLGLGDLAIPADYDADGVTDFAVFRQTSGEWFIRHSFDGTMRILPFGARSASNLGDRPVPADYDGDGKADIAIYRETTGEWFLLTSRWGSFHRSTLGPPIVGDYPAR